MSTIPAAQTSSKITQKSSKMAFGPQIFFACGAPKKEGHMTRASPDPPSRHHHPCMVPSGSPRPGVRYVHAYMCVCVCTVAIGPPSASSDTQCASGLTCGLGTAKIRQIVLPTGQYPTSTPCVVCEHTYVHIHVQPRRSDGYHFRADTKYGVFHPSYSTLPSLRSK